MIAVRNVFSPLMLALTYKSETAPVVSDTGRLYATQIVVDIQGHDIHLCTPSDLEPSSYFRKV